MLSLDEADNDPSRFLTYLIAAIQGSDADIGAEAMSLLHSAHVLSVEMVLTALINEVATTGGELVLVLDDYHVIEARPVHQAVNFLVDHLPSQLHLVIASHSDPPLPCLACEVAASWLSFVPPICVSPPTKPQTSSTR